MMRSTRWAALTAAVLVVAGCGDDEAGSDATTTDVPAAAAITTTATTEPVATTEPAEPAVFVADATPLTKRFSPVDPGTHRVDTLGTPFTFTTVEPMFVQPNLQGFFVLTDPGSNGPGDRDIVFLRLSELSDPTDPSAPTEGWPEGWPASDLSGWIENLGDEIVVSNVSETTLGGLPATRFDMALGEHGCSLSEPFCLLLGTNHGLQIKDLYPGSQYRVWVVDQFDEDPVAVIVGINRDSDAGFFDTADTVLSTLAFGEVGPNPVFVASGGPVELSFLGGVRVEVAEGALVYEEPAGVGGIASGEDPGDTEFLTNPTAVDREPIDSIDQLVAVLEEGRVEVTEIDPTTIGGVEARVFEIGASGGPPLLVRSPDSDLDWFPPPRGRMWSIDHPERGLLMITAEAFNNPDEVFPVILAQTEPIIASMEFVDLG